ncbi:MAG: hypothetical protein LBE20_03615 [Deltaproteobacteria bacterium]|jgi:hypothetical protein|nr:hypothetical protein [Deltaproteobacteria bacterium]
MYYDVLKELNEADKYIEANSNNLCKKFKTIKEYNMLKKWIDDKKNSNYRKKIPPVVGFYCFLIHSREYIKGEHILGNIYKHYKYFCCYNHFKHYYWGQFCFKLSEVNFLTSNNKYTRYSLVKGSWCCFTYMTYYKEQKAHNYCGVPFFIHQLNSNVLDRELTKHKIEKKT